TLTPWAVTNTYVFLTIHESNSKLLTLEQPGDQPPAYPQATYANPQHYDTGPYYQSSPASRPAQPAANDYYMNHPQNGYYQGPPHASPYRRHHNRLAIKT